MAIDNRSQRVVSLSGQEAGAAQKWEWHPAPDPPSEYADTDALLNEWHTHCRRNHQIELRIRPHLQNAQQRYDEASSEWDNIHGDEDRYPRYWPAWGYAFFMGVLAVCEAPINRLSFELFFQESPLLSLTVAFLVGGVLMTLAHFIGVSSRRFGYNVRRTCRLNPETSAFVASLAPGFFIVLGLALMLMICYGVAILRQGYLSFVTQPDPSFSALINSGQYGQAAAQLVLHMALAVEGWIFYIINLAIVAVGLLAAFFSHDPHPEFQRTDLAKKSANASLARIKVQQGNMMAAEARRFSDVVRRLQRT
ncbi:MAG: hypothetical protein ABUS57_01865 [Pseudomonadota bacterium]